MKNLWFLSEEKPRTSVLLEMINRFCKDQNYKYTSDKIHIIPIIKNKKFTFVYRISGINCDKFKNIFIRIVSGYATFVDYLVFYQDQEPNESSIPLYAIEETKTDDSESRNTGVYQRCTKFILVSYYYPNVKKIMLYNLRIKQKNNPTPTNIFGTKMLLTMGVEISGKRFLKADPFYNIKEIIQANQSINAPPEGNVPIKIKRFPNKITVSGRLFKANRLSHDPNIGALTAICCCLRILGWKKDIIITKHGLLQEHVGKNNKFIKIANKLDIKLDGLLVPVSTLNKEYWHFESTGEKNASIFLHLVIEEFTKGKAIYENHGGCERGYLYDKHGQPIVIEKYQKGLRESYKSGNKDAIISLPDLIIFDQGRNLIIDIEGKTFITRKDGIEELKNYDYIEELVIKPLYKPSGFIRTVVVFGSNNNTISEKEIGFMLNINGEMIVNKNAPEIFKEAIKNLLSF